MAVDARFILDADAAPIRADKVAHARTDFGPLYNPQTIAVLGASSQGANMGTRYIEGLRRQGFTGRIVPIHPKADEIAGLPAASNIQDVEGVVRLRVRRTAGGARRRRTHCRTRQVAVCSGRFQRLLRSPRRRRS
ncbi:MAG: CoA-binding protein [Cumulibacter sp.]